MEKQVKEKLDCLLHLMKCRKKAFENALIEKESELSYIKGYISAVVDSIASIEQTIEDCEKLS